MCLLLSVNEKPVTDSAAGCDRAKLVVECMVENKDIVSISYLDEDSVN